MREGDPRVRSELRRLLSQVEGLATRHSLTVNTPDAPGSLAALDGALPNGRFVGIHAGQAGFAAVDHLRGWSIIVDSGRMPVQAQMTLIRGALEGSVRCRWLVDPEIDQHARLARGFAAKRDDYLERNKFEVAIADTIPAGGPSSGRTATERLAELELMRLAAGVPVVKFTDTTTLMKEYDLLGMYRLASAFAHGKEWSYTAVTITDRVDMSDGVSRGQVSAHGATLVAMTGDAVDATELAIAALERYCGLR